jgi:manganese-dependent inorganic pyrophosphatase
MGLDEFWKKQGAARGAHRPVRRAPPALRLPDGDRHHRASTACFWWPATRVERALAADYHPRTPQVFDLPGVVSRKKQLFPYLSSLVGKLTPP